MKFAIIQTRFINIAVVNINKSSDQTVLFQGPAADCIQGFSLTSKNYEEAKQILEERFGNPQIIISAHMNVVA